MTKQKTIGRRPFLASIAAMGVSYLVPTTASAAQNIARVLDPKNKQDEALIYRKLAWSMDDRLAFWWQNGPRYVLIDSELFPFGEMQIGIYFKTRDLGDGDYEVATMTIYFYTDLTSGEYQTQWQNPITGKLVDLAYPAAPRKKTFKFNDGRAGKPSIEGIGPARVADKNVWVREDYSGARPATEKAPAYKHNDMIIYFGTVQDVLDPAVKMPLSGQTMTDINSFPAYLGMGDRSGSWYSRAYGRKVSSFDEMLPAWREQMLKQYPDIVKDPVKALLG